MNISELSRLSGTNTATIRYYEQILLLPKAKRKANGYREYGQQDLVQLFLIKQAQLVGFSLTEIKTMLPVNGTNWNHDQLLSNLESKVSEIEAVEQKLALNKLNLLMLIHAMKSKPEDMTCTENVQRLLDMYFPQQTANEVT